MDSVKGVLAWLKCKKWKQGGLFVCLWRAASLPVLLPESISSS